MTGRWDLRKSIITAAVGAVIGLTPTFAAAQSDPTYPEYRIRYLSDWIERDEDGERLVEEGVFNTTAQANQVINVLAHLMIAWRVDCACEEVRRDVMGADDLESDLLEMLTEYGYVSRLVPASEVGSLPPFVRVLTPYLTLSGSGYRGETGGGWSPWTNWGGGGSSTTLDPNNPRQYARVDNMGIFVDTRLSGQVQDRARQLMGGYRLDDPASLCAFAALERSPDDMMSWVLIRDLRRTWSGETAR
jgi:hypothetical protein